MPVPVPTHYTLDVAGVRDTEVAMRTLAPQAETVLLSTSTEFRDGAVARYADSIAPELTRTGPADVPGHHAFYVRSPGRLDSIGTISPDLVGTVPRIAWNEDGWTTVVLTGSDGSRADALTLARAVRTVRQPVALPFRFTRLPAGLVPDSVTRYYPPLVLATIARIDLSEDGSTAAAGTFSVQLADMSGEPARSDLAQMEGAELAQRWHGNAVFSCAVGCPARDPGVIVPLPDHLVLVVAGAPLRTSSITPMQLMNLISGLDIATDPSDPSTWFTSGLFPK